MFIIRLHKDGLKFGTINDIHVLAKSIFKTAMIDDCIKKNPFDFKCKDIVPNNTKLKVGLTKQQKESLLTFMKESKVYKKHLDMVTVLLETGLRISELAGLTKDDIDFIQHRIKVDHQLLIDKHGHYYVSPPKSVSGERYIPMTKEVEATLKHILQTRSQPKIEYIVDGYSGFIFLNKTGKPLYEACTICTMRHMKTAYNKVNKIPIIALTPHIFRHTFCSEKLNAGMNIKTLQYIMGHSKADMTLNRYSHVDYSIVQDEMNRIDTSKLAK